MSDFNSVPVANSLGMPLHKGFLGKKAPANRVRLSKKRDCDTDVYWLSNKLNNTEFDYWLVVQQMDYFQYGVDTDLKYHLEIMVVAPSQVPRQTRDSYLNCLGITDEEWNQLDIDSDPGELALMLAETGCGAQVWFKDGNNKQQLYKAALSECQAIEMLLGFYLDRPVNRIGTTGWDMLSGDIEAPLRRHQES